MTINAESAGLVAHMNYIATVVVETLAGSSSDSCNFSKLCIYFAVISESKIKRPVICSTRLH